VLPLLLGPHSSRPWSAYLGVTTLQLPREDGLPFGPGLPPAKDAGQRKQYEEIADGVASAVNNPVREYTNRILNDLGVPGLKAPLFESLATLADMMLHPCVPAFEFPLLTQPQNPHYIGPCYSRNLRADCVKSTEREPRTSSSACHAAVT
jgi:hypothetical protein